MATPTVEITDAELTALALAADPDAPFDDDAAPFGAEPVPGTELLPEWYMPAPLGSSSSRKRSVAVAVIVASLVIVNGAGLCVTYGLPEIAW